VQNRLPRRYDPDETDVMETVAMLLAEGLAALGASDGAVEGLAANLPRRFEGSTLVPGIAIGPVVRLGVHQGPRRVLADDPDWETGRLARALRTVQAGLDELMAGSLPQGDAPREILEAYRLVAADQGWVRRAAEAIRGGLSAEAAVHRVAGELRDRMRRVTDPYIRERLADLEDIASRLLAALDEGAPTEPPPPGAILVARRLGPAQLLDWHAKGIAGFAVEEGSAGGHAAIIARALGIPALGGVRGVLDAAEDGEEAILDADEEQLVLRPEQAVRDTFRRVLGERLARQAGWAELRHRPGTTRDGVTLKLMLNMGLALELDQLAATGADGVGLFRTEIAMLARGAIADVPEQASVYARVLDAAAGRPVMFRTLDLGGDKILPYGRWEREENPALGWRAIRIALDRPALLRYQVRALLMASADKVLRVLLPMVSDVSEFNAARALIDRELERARLLGLPQPRQTLVGAMLEVPALMFMLPQILRSADFVSIGSNDLFQFIFAVDRTNPRVARRYDALSPAALTVVRQIVRSASDANGEVSLCGEMAGRPLEAMALIGAGMRTLSMQPANIGAVKIMIRSLDTREIAHFVDGLCGRTDHSLRTRLAAFAAERGVAIK
jgi:phosphotransferase system enzyme I (PtsP)